MDIDLRGVGMAFKGLTVKQFVAEVIEYFRLSPGDVEVLTGGAKGSLRGPTYRMEDLAASDTADFRSSSRRSKCTHTHAYLPPQLLRGSRLTWLCSSMHIPRCTSYLQ